MRTLHVVFLSILSLQLATSLQAGSSADPSRIWNDLRAKREALKSFHQEFEISRSFKTVQNTQASKSSVVIDSVDGRWRERRVSGGGDRVTVFDGQDQFEFEDGGDEYVRLKRSTKEELPQPGPYSIAHLDLSKAVERERGPCGLTNADHECVVIDIPVKPWVRNAGNDAVSATEGTTRAILDSVTGLLISCRTVQNMENRRQNYQADTTYRLLRMTYNGKPGESLFQIPPTVTREVKELSRWNAGKIKKQLAGRTAPDFALTDLQGKTIKLSDLKGRTVLLDFWATWCGPCRADGPSLDRLYQKYGGKNLTIIGISVDEERTVVQKFLSEHPHPYMVALTTENEMPRPYQIGVFPTYIVIDPDGNVASAAEGDRGFSDLRKLLSKAGLETD